MAGNGQSVEATINKNYLEAHRRLMGRPPAQESNGTYKKLTGSSPEALQAQINALTSQILELKSQVLREFALLYERKRAEEAPPVTLLDSIIEFVCKHEIITKKEMLSPRRDKAATTKRHLAVYLCWKCTDKSLPQIGRSFHRDHTTILAARDKMKISLLNDQDLATKVDWYEKQIQEKLCE